MLRTSTISAIRTGIICALAIIIIKILSTLLVYHFFRFDIYLSIVAIAFLLTGYSLNTRFRPVPSLNGFANEDTKRPMALKSILNELTGRELAVFRLLSEEKTNKEIACAFGVSVSTIKTHINNLYAKTGCRNRKEARLLLNEMVEKNILL